MDTDSELKDLMFDMKSKKIYDGWILKYTTFCEKEKITDIDSLAFLLKFFVHQSTVYSASTLWQGYSCLGKYFLVFYNKDIKENMLLKQLLKKKQKYHKVKKSMVLSKEELDLFLQNTENYIKCFPEADRCGRFFRKINKFRIGTNEVIGKNTIAQYPSVVAKYLNLENPESYTGHCIRRSASTILADSGKVDKITLKRAGRWKSDVVCDGYIEESKHSKKVIANALASNSDLCGVGKNNDSVQNINISNVTGNIVLHL